MRAYKVPVCAGIPANGTAGECGLMLECPEAEPWMTAELAQLYPDRPIRWRVSAIRPPSGFDDEVTDSFSQELFGAA